MQDHYVARVSNPVEGAETVDERSRGLPLAGEVVRRLFTGKGMLPCSPSIVAALVKVLDKSAASDMQVTFAPAGRRGTWEGRGDAAGPRALHETFAFSAVKRFQSAQF